MSDEAISSFRMRLPRRPFWTARNDWYFTKPSTLFSQVKNVSKTTSKPRVLFMMPSQITPSEIWLERMMEELRDVLVLIVYGGMGTDGYWNDGIPMRSLRPYQNFLKRGFSRLLGQNDRSMCQKNLLRAISSSGATHILCHYGAFASGFMDVWRETIVPLFVHFHGYDAAVDRRTEDNPEKAYFSPDYKKNLLELSHRAIFIANSEFTRKLLVDAGISDRRIHVKYLGVPIPLLEKKHERKENIQILHLGRLVDFKSPDRTIRAFELACQRGLKGQLTIAGDGPMRITCELLRVRSGWKDSIQILGMVSPEVGQKLLADADIFTQHNIQGEITGQSECLGVSVLEAMAMGVPIVATRSGGVSETVVDGESGFLVEPANVADQAECFLRLAEDPVLRQKMGKNGRERIQKNFSLEHEKRKLFEIMKVY